MNSLMSGTPSMSSVFSSQDSLRFEGSVDVASEVRMAPALY